MENSTQRAHCGKWRGGSLKPTSQFLLPLRTGSHSPLVAAGQAAERGTRV